MGWGENIWAFLAAFAGWTFSRFTVPRRVEWANVVSGLGILALFFPADFLPTIVCAHENCTAPIAVRFVDQCVCRSRRSHFVFP